MTNKIRIVAAVVDTRQLTLYKESGETVIIPQGDPRLRRIVDEASPQLTSQGWADIEVNTHQENAYVQFEEQSNGMVRFFRIAKDKLKQLLALGVVEGEPFPDAVAPMTAGSVPVTTSQAVADAPAPVVSAPSPAMNAVDEIIANAVPVAHADFHETTVAKQANVVEEDGSTPNAHTSDDAPDTMIAVVGNKVIPGVEKIKSQFGRAAKHSSTKGVENFLRRLGSVIEQRSHSVEDLLTFMERGDLPIADDGSILIYKILRNHGGESHRKVYVDCHTKRVEQWVGAYVCMDKSLVDHARNNECSNGLHVARRGYLSGFGGDVCVLAKLAPEDVITVPTYDANKMRVCGYHILFELTPSQFSQLKSNKAMTDVDGGATLLGKAIAGDHIHRTHEVRITQQQGGGVKVVELAKQQPKAVAEVKEAVAMSNNTELVDTPINPKEVAKNVEQLSRKDQAAKLYADWQAGVPNAEQHLRHFKKLAKVGWDKLGIPTDKAGQPVLTGKKSAKLRVVENPSRPMPKEGQPIPYGERTVARSVTAKINKVIEGEGSPRERIQKLLAIGLDGKGVAQAILNIKKASKKSWDALGVPFVTVDNIMKRTGNS